MVIQVGFPLADRGINEESILRAFEQMDDDKNSFIGLKDIIETLKVNLNYQGDRDLSFKSGCKKRCHRR